jgi:hypothetical protein
LPSLFPTFERAICGIAATRRGHRSHQNGSASRQDALKSVTTVRDPIRRNEIEEIRRIKRPLIFFVDDKITSNMDQAKEFFRALIPLRIRWVSQASINAAHDVEFLQLIKASGCAGLLIGKSHVI